MLLLRLKNDYCGACFGSHFGRLLRRRKRKGAIKKYFFNILSIAPYILIHTCMKQDQSYFGQVFYLRENNFGLNCKKECLLQKFLIKLLHYLPKIILQGRGKMKYVFLDWWLLMACQQPSDNPWH